MSGAKFIRCAIQCDGSVGGAVFGEEFQRQTGGRARRFIARRTELIRAAAIAIAPPRRVSIPRSVRGVATLRDWPAIGADRRCKRGPLPRRRFFAIRFAILPSTTRCDPSELFLDANATENYLATAPPQKHQGPPRPDARCPTPGPMRMSPRPDRAPC